MGLYKRAKAKEDMMKKSQKEKDIDLMEIVKNDLETMITYVESDSRGDIKKDYRRLESNMNNILGKLKGMI